MFQDAGFTGRLVYVIRKDVPAPENELAQLRQGHKIF